MQPTDSECIGKAANVLAYLVLAAACAASALASAQGAAKERFAGAVEFLAGDVMIEVFADKQEALKGPSTSYFEFHMKLALPKDADIESLARRFKELGAHLSRNAHRAESLGRDCS